MTAKARARLRFQPFGASFHHPPACECTSVGNKYLRNEWEDEGVVSTREW